MEGYLLDTNAVSHWLSGHPKLAPRLNALNDNTQIRVSAITLGEIAFGNNLILSDRDPAVIDVYERWVYQTLTEERILNVTRTTREHYGLVRARIFEHWRPREKGENHVEKCFDKITGKDLGIDENDLWIAAQAMEHNLILITHDNMECIREAAEHVSNAMRDIGWEFRYEDWTK